MTVPKRERARILAIGKAERIGRNAPSILIKASFSFVFLLLSLVTAA